MELLIVIVSSLGLFAWGCNGDDDNNDDDSQDTGTQKEDAGDEDAGSTDQNVDCDPTGEGKCQNEADCPIIEKGTAREIAQQCGTSCLSDADPTVCSQTCVVEQTGLTTDCAGCYLAIVDCTFQNCLALCSADPDSLDCFNCQVDEGCRETFNTCSGLPESPAPSE